MANGMYDAGRNAFARGEVAWKATGGSTIKVQAIDAALYTADLTTDATLDDIPGGARIGDPVTLVLLDPTAGVCDATDTQLPATGSGQNGDAIVLYKDTGTESTSTLLVYLDTATGLPFVTNGAPIDLVWSNGANKIFKL